MKDCLFIYFTIEFVSYFWLSFHSLNLMRLHRNGRHCSIDHWHHTFIHKYDDKLIFDLFLRNSYTHSSFFINCCFWYWFCGKEKEQDRFIYYSNRCPIVNKNEYKLDIQFFFSIFFGNVYTIIWYTINTNGLIYE